MKTTKAISKFDYLYNRPFLCVVHYKQPARKQTVKTEHKGWMNDRDNILIKEQPMLVDRVSHKMMREASVIIDILGEKLIKNRLRLGSSDLDPAMYDSQMFEHFKLKYAEYIEQATQVWASRVAAAETV